MKNTTPHSRKHRGSCGARLLAGASAILCLVPLPLSAQSISLTGPAAPVSVRDADEFATDVLGHPWDMNRLRDVALDAGFLQPTATGGIWQALSYEPMPYYEPLFPGYNDMTYSIYFSIYDGGTPYGPLNPVVGTKYSCFSMRTSLPQPVRSSIMIAWTQDHRVMPTNAIAISDQAPAVDGFRSYDIDLTGTTWLDEKVPALVPAMGRIGRTWRDTAYGLMIIPASSFPANTLHQIDWMRIYDPADSPTVDITWTTTGIPNDNSHGVDLYVDRDAAGYDGDLFVAGLANDGSFRLRTGSLPPGTHYFYLKAFRYQGNRQELATSGYSAPLTVQCPPSIEFTAPCFTSGVDYATSELGNPWDMSDSADVRATYDLAWVSFQNGAMQALAGISDPQVTLNTKRAGVDKPIDTRKYRYLTFRIKCDASGYLNFMDRIAGGWVARVLWWNQGSSTDGSCSKDIPLLEDWRSYTMDLWDDGFLETRQPLGTPQSGWQNISQAKTFRLDPLEVFKSTWFWLDDVKLCAENVPAGHRYRISWLLSDADSSHCQVRIFCGYYSEANYEEMPVPVLETNQVPGKGSFDWDMTGIPNGEYYLRAELSDGANTKSYRSKVPVVVSDSFPRTRNVAAVTPTIYYKPRGWWVTLFPGAGYTTTPWGRDDTPPVPADYDGDGKTDIAVYWPSKGWWYIRQSSDGQLMTGGPISLGWSGVKTAPGDYDGDGKADAAVYDPATGQWHIRYTAGGSLVKSWGWRSAIPVPGDYDGDGTTDTAVYDTNVGQWYISCSGGGTNSAYLGWAGVVPVPADYDGDGRTDMGVWDTKVGEWYINYSSGGSKSTVWGWKGVTPVPADYDGDGKADRAFCDPVGGYWHILYFNGESESFGPWGWGGSKSIPLTGRF
jgi:hypothetical protein